MIESPLIELIMAERTREIRQRDILRFLTARFGSVPSEVAAAVRLVGEPAQLDDLVDWSAGCPDLDSFRARLPL